MLDRFRQLTKVEKVVVAFLTVVAVLSGARVVGAFYQTHSEMIPAEGGVYQEGMVGKIGTLNPLFAPQGSLTHDVTQLIFSGLTRYDPKTKEIVPDLADYQVSDTGKEYTFVIKEGATWHDSTPVTSNDVLFTYETVIKNPEFKGVILNYNDYSGVRAAKIDERTVKFFLEKPDSFFLVKTMTGLLPHHLLEKIPPSLLSEAPFNLEPVGSGRYQSVSMVPINDYLEISLTAFEDYYGAKPHIENVLFKVFQTEKELAKHLGELDGIRTVSDELEEKLRRRSRWVVHRYYLPQTVAVFMNTDSPILKNKKVRLALQLGTDKMSLAEAIGETQIIDTPLLEIDQKNWVHQYSLKKANGALFDTEWKLPNKDQETGNSPQKTENEKPKEEPSFINGPNGGQDWKTTSDKVTLTGTAPPRTKAIRINDYELSKFVPGDRAWSYIASLEYDNLQKGDNVYQVYGIDFNGEGKLLDTITITHGDETTFDRLEKEQLQDENLDSPVLPNRVNERGEPLVLQMLAPQTPSTYAEVAGILKKQWEKIGVELDIEILENEAFQERLKNREYDLLIFGQNLGYNLDAYPYWHSSQAKPEGLNLSQFKNFAVDSLLEEARRKLQAEDRKKTLNKIQEIMSLEVPAVFLYSPTYLLAQARDVQSPPFENFATTSDRLATLSAWYGHSRQKLKEGVGLFTFLGWLFRQF